MFSKLNSKPKENLNPDLTLGTTTPEKNKSFLKDIIDNIIKHYQELNAARDFDKKDPKKEKILKIELKRILDEAISNHTTETVIEDNQPFTDLTFKKNILATVGFDLSVSAMSKIMIFIIDRKRIKKIQTIEKKAMIILSLSLTETAEYLFTGGFKSGVGLWKFNKKKSEFEFLKTLGFTNFQIRNVFWNQQMEILFVKRRYEGLPYDEIFGYYEKKGEEFKEILFETPIKSLETMMDNDHFSDHGKYFVMSLPDADNPKFLPRPFFSMERPRRREKKVIIANFDRKNDRIIPVLKLKSLSGKIAFIENYSYISYLGVSGTIRLYKLPNITESASEIDLKKSDLDLINEAKELEDEEAQAFQGITQSEIDSFDLNESDELIALTERNKMYVYEIEENWTCTLIMEYEDKVVLTPPILSISFSSDSNFILCRGHQKIVIVDIYGEQKMQNISTLRGVDQFFSPKKIKKMSINKEGQGGSKNRVFPSIDDTVEKSLIGKDLIDDEEDNEQKFGTDKEESTFGFESQFSLIKKNPNAGLNIGKRFQAEKPIFYYSRDETCVMVIDGSLEDLVSDGKILKICRWTEINIEGKDQSKVRSKIYTFNIPDEIKLRVLAVNDDNTAIILSTLRRQEIWRKAGVTGIKVLVLEGNKFEMSNFLLRDGETHTKYFKAQFLHRSKNLLTLDIEFNPKIWEYDPARKAYKPFMILQDQKLNYSHSLLSLDNHYLITENKKKISFWKYNESKKNKLKYNFILDQKIKLSEETGKVDKIFITKNKRIVLILIEPCCDKNDPVSTFKSHANSEYLLRVFLRDKKGKYSLVQTESIAGEFEIKIDIESEYILMEFEETTEIWRISENSIDYENTLPNVEYDQISPSFSRLLKIEKNSSGYLLFKIEDFRAGFLQIESSLKTLYILKELFDKPSQVINKKAIEFVLENSRKFNTSKSEEMQELHSKYSLLLLTMFTNNPQLLRIVLNEINYIPFFYQKDYDPLDFALTMGHIESLDEITNYLKISDNGRSNPIISYLNVNRLSNCMETYNQNFREFVIDSFLEEAVPSSEEIEVIDSYPLKDTGYEIVECWTRFLDEKLHENIMKESEKNFLKNEDPVRVKILTTSFAINTNIVHNSNTLLLQSIENLPDELIVGNIRHILKYLWKKNWYIVAIFSILNWANYSLFILFILFFKDISILGTLNIILSFLFLFFEILMANRDWSRWARDAENYYDIIQFTAMPAIIILNFYGVDDYSKVIYNFAVNMTILVAGYRSLLKVKIFEKVRYMVDMIRQVFSDMIGFSVILGISILYFTFIGINSSRATDDFEGDIDNINDFLTILDAYYNVAFGDFTILKKEHWSHIVHYMATTVFLALVMFNLMAATIWETFGNFQAKKTLVDLRSISGILVDYTHLFSYFSSFGCMKRLDKKGLKFLCLIVPEDDDGGVVQELKEIKKDVNENAEEMEAASNKIIQDIIGVEVTLGEFKEKMDKVDDMEEMILQVKGTVEEMMRMMKLKNEEDKELEEINNE